jgi:hypothetical protein|eukprot:COSAG06_NODE_2534_length_6710_cov_23.487521_3_plen_201_part_00
MCAKRRLFAKTGSGQTRKKLKKTRFYRRSGTVGMVCVRMTRTARVTVRHLGHRRRWAALAATPATSPSVGCVRRVTARMRCAARSFARPATRVARTSGSVWNRPLLRCHSMLKTNICQDTLGTNVGKVEKRDTRFGRPAFWPPLRCENGLLEPFIYKSHLVCCQGRLGTNIGKTQKKMAFFQTGAGCAIYFRRMMTSLQS